jgi:hypothetical protein
MNFIDILIGHQAGFSFPWFALAHAALVLLFALRLIWTRRPVSVSFAWFLVVVMLPIIRNCALCHVWRAPSGP